MDTTIARNIETVQANIKQAADKAGRNPEDILLLAVSKTIDPDRIQLAVDCGLTELGENKVQEIMDKYDKLQGIKWHLIGHLQTNKVKYIIDKVCLIHSVDSLKLAKEISRHAVKKNLTMDILIEVNVASEESKFGVSMEEVEPLVREISKLPNVCLKGLMTVAPYVENAELNRPVFQKMKQLFVDINGKSIDNITMDTLSMGMTGDYGVAIEEGATIVRVGTGIFGERVYL